MKILEKEYERKIEDIRKEIDSKFIEIFKTIKNVFYRYEVIEHRINRLMGYLECAYEMNVITIEEYCFLTSARKVIEIEMKKREVKELEECYC